MSFLLKQMSSILGPFPKGVTVTFLLYANKSITLLYTKKGYEYNHPEPVTKQRQEL